MANDASNHPTNSSDADMNVAGDHAEFDAVQLAQANAPAQQPQQPQKTAAIPAVPNGTVQVEIPQGEKVVRVAVANGETVILPAPFDDQAALAAKEGNGNLAIRVGDITVLLEGYQQTVDAAGNPTVTLKDPQGDVIDIAVVLASTDPNLDIETAAGGDAAGAQGADNTGALLSQFGLGAGLGGLNAVGVLDATSLQYKLIDNSILREREDLLEPSQPLDIKVTGPKDILSQSHLRDPIVTINDYSASPTFAEFINGNGKAPAWDNHFGDFDGTDPLDASAMHTTGEVVVDPHNDSTVNVDLDPSGLNAQGLTSNGVPLVYVLSADGSTIFGFRGDGTGGTDGALVLVVHVADTGTKAQDGTTHFVVDYYLVNRLDDLAGDSNGGEDATHLDVGFDVTTSADQTGSASSTVNFKDDAPIAADDTDSVGNQLSTDGNVITGVGTTNDDPNKLSDLGGADGSTVTSLTGKNGSDNDASDKLTVKGEHGTLVMNADGTYTYTRDNGDPTVDKNGNTITLQDKFTYTLTDGDGDKTTANLTIDIKDSDIKIKDLTPKADGGDVTVDEDDLADGSDTTKESTTQGGDFTITSPDGVGNLSIGGHAVITNGVFAATSFTTPLGNTLSITGYNAATGQVTYTYTLLDNEGHASANGENSLFEDFKVDVTDKDGDAASSTLSVNIVDDVPTARNDVDTIATGGTSADGNVITGANTTSGAAGADTKGADGATVSAVTGFNGSADNDASDGLKVDGQYGKLTLNADGSYTYTRNAGSPGGVSDTFTYTLKDGDGDTSTATLTINVGDDKPTIDAPTADGATKVYEKGLPQGSGELADGNSGNNSDSSETVKGTINYYEGDAPAAITITDKNGVAITAVAGVDIVGADGTLHIDSVGGGKIDYTYTLTTNTSGDTTTDSFKLSITDKDGDNDTDNLVIKIVDDTPDAKNDTDSVGAGMTTDGNVITGVGTTSGAAGADVKGADGASVSQVVGQTTDSDPAGGFTVQGQYGKLVMQADGSYVYTRDSDAPTLDKDGKVVTLTDTFTYTLKDGDGDTDPATLVVTIKDSDIKILDLTPKANGGDTKVEEDGLSAARGPNESAGSDGSGPTTGNGTFTISSPDGVQSLMVDGKAVVTNGVFTAITIDTALGNKLNITAYDANTGTVTYNYVLLDNEQHDAGAGKNSLYEDFSVIVTDKDGDSASDTLSVNIVDDVPDAKNDTDTIVTGGTSTDGNVITGANTSSGAAGADVQGADGAKVSGVTGFNGSADNDASDGLKVDGQYGKLTLNADGSYTYTRNAGSPGGVTDVFTYTLKDGDGDTDTATLTINVGDDRPTIDAPTADGMTKVYEKGLPQGSGEIADGNPNNNSDSSEIVKGTISYTEGDAPAAITITDKNGVAVTVVAGVNILGADGTLHIDSVGGGKVEYTYTLTTNTSGDNTTDTFGLSITDKDGDNDTDNLVIKIVDDVPDAKNDTDSVANDKLSTDGNVITGVGTTSGAAGADVKGADGAAISQLVGFSGSTDSNPAGGFTVQGQYGTLVMQADGSYVYTRNNSDPTVDKDGKPVTYTDTFTYTLKDGDTDVDTATLVVTIKDDGCNITNLTPKASGGDTTVDEDGLLASRGANESAGSDGSGPTTNTGDFNISAPDGVQTLTIGGHAVITNGVFAASSWTTGFGNTISITGYDANTGKVSYSYTLNDNEAHATGNGENSLYEDLNVSLTDKDGDTATGTLSVNIVDDVAVALNGAKSMTGTDAKYNVLLIMDVSGSMGDPSGVNGLTRLQLEGQSIINLLNAYAASGQTMVQIATFSSNANVPNPGGWMTVADAIALVNQIVANGPQQATDYHDAIAAGIQAYNTDGKIVDATNVAYFFSDGKPNEPDENTGPLTNGEVTNWVNFVNTNDINAYAIGLGTDTVKSTLDPIAYNGDTGVNTDAVIVTDLNNLASVINSTLPEPQSGDIVSALGGTFGADGGHVATIVINGVTYTYAQAVAANAAHELTIATAGGSFKIDFDDGKYTYTPDFTKNQTNLDIGFTLIDNDGDTAGATLKLLAPLAQFAMPVEPTPVTTTNIFGTGNYNAPAGTNSADHIRDWTSGGSANDVHNSTINGQNGNDWIEAGAGNDTVTGGTGLDKILGGAGNDNLQGQTGNDWLDGGTGNDHLQGGADTDTMIGGAGSDKMDGGDGTDYFKNVDTADLDGTNTLDGTHSIDGGAGSDYVDLSGLASFGSAQAARIENVEALSFTGGGSTAVTLDYNSVLNMTDANNNLVIHGDQGSDTVALSGGFTKIGTDVAANDGQHYDVFQAGVGANQVTVFVDHNLNASAT
ncbi:VCBS domain-containing protein [Dongia sp.]|uniref:VCBS domain-containing protein n=1 Tax=Dongia sp. TaxID=1977262 RepID=UPI003753DBA5